MTGRSIAPNAAIILGPYQDSVKANRPRKSTKRVRYLVMDRRQTRHDLAAAQIASSPAPNPKDVRGSGTAPVSGAAPRRNEFTAPVLPVTVAAAPTTLVRSKKKSFASEA
jgi:hypothetical protein